MRLCKDCSAMAGLTEVRCERCGRAFPGWSRRALKQALVRGGVLLGAISVLTAFAMS
jgi:hypothetical protein